MPSRLTDRVERNYERMRKPSYGWWILALIPVTYAALVIWPVVFGDTTFVNALTLSDDGRGFLGVVVVGTLFELAVHQYLTRRADNGEPDAAANPNPGPTVGPTDAAPPASDASNRAVSQ